MVRPPYLTSNVAFFAALIAGNVAEAQQQNSKAKPEVPAISSADLGLDYKKLVGKRVRVTDCTIIGAKLEIAGCPIPAGNSYGGMINVGYGSADRADRKRAMEECNTGKPEKRCVAEVTGTVRESLLGSVVGLDNATLRWREP